MDAVHSKTIENNNNCDSSAAKQSLSTVFLRAISMRLTIDISVQYKFDYHPLGATSNIMQCVALKLALIDLCMVAV